MTDCEESGIESQLCAVAMTYKVDMNPKVTGSRSAIRGRALARVVIAVWALVALLMLLGVALSAQNQSAADDRSLLYCIEDSTYLPGLPEQLKKEATQRCVEQVTNPP
jgi:hypothetical protein